MAGIDKIYVDSYKQYKEFYDWCVKFNDLCIKDTSYSLLDGFYYTEEEIIEYYGKEGFRIFGFPITNFREIVDRWLYKHCPISFVRERLDDQYNRMNIPISKIELYLNRG